MNYCSQCAAPLPPNAKFCPQCAAVVEMPSDKPLPTVIVRPVQPAQPPPKLFPQHSTTIPPEPNASSTFRATPMAVGTGSKGCSFLALTFLGLVIVMFFVIVSSNPPNSPAGNNDSRTKVIDPISVYATETPSPTVKPTATPTKAEFQKRRQAAMAHHRALLSAANKMRFEKDEVTGIKWFQPQNSPAYNNSRNALYLYFGQEGTTVLPPRLKIQYVGENWVFIKEYIIKVDSQTFNITPEYGEVKRDNSGGQVWEWYDKSATDENLEMIKAIIHAKGVIVRFDGDQNQQDYYMPDDERQELKDSLAAHAALEEMAAHPDEFKSIDNQTDSPSDAPDIKLRKDMTGDDVKDWQEFLIEQGFMEPPALGNFGDRTYKATIAFQKRYHLVADGTVGSQTLRKARALGYLH